MDISNNLLNDLPIELGELTKLKDLNLSSSHLQRLPDLRGLKPLTSLDVIPSAIKDLPLNTLLLSNNKIQCIPEFKRFPKIFSLNYNRITQLPASLRDCGSKLIVRGNYMNLSLSIGDLDVRQLVLAKNHLILIIPEIESSGILKCSI